MWWDGMEDGEFCRRLVDMDMEPERGFLWWLCQVVVFVLMVGLSIAGVWSWSKRWESDGYRLGVQWMQQEAVRLGHAEYYLDENNEMVWGWK